MKKKPKPVTGTTVTTNNKQQNDASGIRLKEILGVLKKHHITSGIQPEKLRQILEDLGPTYVKLGQIMSMRSDMLPESYCKELERLRTDVKPLPFYVIKSEIERELGKPAEAFFNDISPEPLGSASIAQVHPAVLKNGEQVVIKVQRPRIHEIMEEDIKLMRHAVSLLKFTIGTGELIDFRTVLDELWKTSQEEMDFLKEAANCDTFFQNQKDIKYVTCPIVYHELTTSHILVMSYVDGIQIDHIDALEEQGYDMTEIGRKAAENYCKQILEDGFFHADPHPGNIRISGGQIAWLDLGMMGTLSSRYRALFKRAVTAVLKNDIYELKNVLLALGESKGRINHARLYTDIDDIVSKFLTTGFGNMDVGDLIEKLLDMIKSHSIAIPPDITLLGRSMVTMEGMLSACSPDVNMFQILSGHMASILMDDFNLRHEIKHNARMAYSSLSKSLEIPAQLSDLLSITKNGQTKLNLELTNAEEAGNRIQNSIHHLSLSILTASLFIGSSLLCLAPVEPLFLGIPWPAFAGFSIAFILFLCLILRIFMHKK